MTDEQLNEALAIDVMGYKKSEDLWILESNVPHGGNAIKYSVEYWNPSTNLNQAFEVLDKWHSLSTCNISHAIYRNGEKYLVTLDCLPFQSVAQVKHKSLARAICESVLMAVRGEK